jgi:glycosyltransferase involved in cell wall biosynthesis
MKKKLGIFLLSYKRPEFIFEAITSILSQDYSDFELIISENSPDDIVWQQLQKYRTDVRVRLVKRTPSLQSLEHFNKILFECSEYEYAMLFHDDDVLMPGAFTEMIGILEKYPYASCVSCNALIVENINHTDKLISLTIKGMKMIERPSQLVRSYMLRRRSHTPFPSYIYRTKFLSGLSLNYNDGGKYSDATFLMSLLHRGPFIWLGQPFLKYRLHGGNDSAALSLSDIMKLCRTFFKAAPASLPLIIFYFFKQLVKKLLGF